MRIVLKPMELGFEGKTEEGLRDDQATLGTRDRDDGDRNGMR